MAAVYVYGLIPLFAFRYQDLLAVIETRRGSWTYKIVYFFRPFENL